MQLHIVRDCTLHLFHKYFIIQMMPQGDDNGDDYSALQRQYPLTYKVSRYCLLALYGSIDQLQLALRQRLYSECQRRNI